MKSLIVLGVLAATISLAAALDYNQGIQEILKIIPGLIQGSPEVIKVVFDNETSLDFGNTITPTQAKNQPLVDWNADSDSYYTLLVIDPDAPSRRNPYLKDIIMWLVGNIKGKDLSTGDVLAEYIGAGPPPRAGMNRYFYLVFKQSGKAKFDEKPISKNTIVGRIGFSTENFTKKYNLGSPVGANHYKSYFDEQVPVLYKQLGCCEHLLSPDTKY